MRVTYKIQLPNSKWETLTTVFDVEFDNINEAEEYMEFGGDGNYILQQHVYIHGFLRNWKVTQISNASDVGWEKHVISNKIRKQHQKKQSEIVKFTSPTGWIDLNGRYFPLHEVAPHIDFAIEYLSKYWQLDFYQVYNNIESMNVRFVDNPTEYLLHIGWAHVMSYGDYRITNKKVINERQLKTVYEYCIFYDLSFKETINHLVI